MNFFLIVWSYLKAKPLNTILNIVLVSLGIGVITTLLLFTHQLQEKISKNGKGIDLVVGAKGSPLQLILCNVFHIDFPTGNIKLFEADRIARNRLVKKAIPMALGDSYQSFRIIGTTKAYTELYQTSLQDGNWWASDMDVTIGSNVAATLLLKPGDEFTSAHGLTEGGHAHDEQKFVVKGILNASNSVIDNLILTNVESIWRVHNLVDSKASIKSGLPASLLVPSAAATDSAKEITSVLIQYRSPMGAIQMPRFINSQTSMQAASPAFETARLFSIMGTGVEVMQGFGYVLILISGMSIFIALYNSLKERRYDLAIMRAMGATRSKLVMSVFLESILLTFSGTTLGLFLGHAALQIMPVFAPEIKKAAITGLVFYPEEWMIFWGSLLLGLVCSVLPAWQAYRTDVSKVLSGN
jgi:putative ABC transport system permease protein